MSVKKAKIPLLGKTKPGGGDRCSGMGGGGAIGGFISIGLASAGGEVGELFPALLRAALLEVLGRVALVLEEDMVTMFFYSSSTTNLYLVLVLIH